jgi:hypothetical protein
MKLFFGKLMEFFETSAMAVAYAEAGEWTTAENILKKDSKQQQKKIDKQNGKKTTKRPGMRAY